TLAFGLPVLARMAASGRSRPHHPKALVLVPTRELAMQVNDVLTPLAKALGLFTKTAFGGAPYSTQIYALERGVDVLVATPGPLGRPDGAGRLPVRAVRGGGAGGGGPEGRPRLPPRRPRAAGADAGGRPAAAVLGHIGR